MSHINSNVPVIAITPDEGPNIANDISNIDEVATDVEDIYFQTEKRKKKSRKHAPKKDLYATDVEDMDGSDDDISSPLIKHANPISIDQVIIQADVPTVEENVKTSDSNSRAKPKLRTQESVTSKTKYLQTNEIELNQVLTDVEDFNDSNDEDEVSEPEPTDTDLLKEIIYDSGTIAISDSVKKFLQAVPSPMVTPIDISDEDLGNQRKCTKKGGKNKSRKQYIDTKSICTNLNELTDVETLHCDSNDETKLKPKHVKGRRHTLPRKLKLDTTDSEDLDVSENEQVKNRRVTVANIPRIGVNQFSFDNPDDEINHSFITIPQMANDGDSDTEGIPMFKNLKNTKRSNQLLQIEERENEGTTDIEDMDGDSEIDEDNTNIEDKDDGFELDLDSNCGVVEEKCSTKKNNKYKVEGSFVREEKNKNWNSTENETDEEDQCDSEISKAELCSPSTDNVDLKFVIRTTKEKPKRVHIKQSNNTLGLPTAENDEVLTDVENLNSSDDDDKNEIPVTVVTGLLSNCLTDSESVDGDIEYKTFEDDDIPDNLPSCSRKLICVKVNENNVSEIVSSTLPDNEDDTDTINLSNETDMEEVSGDEEVYEYVDDKFVIELDVTDQNNTDYKDTLKLPRKIQSDEDDTDIEDISEVKPKTRKSSHRFLNVAQEETDKYTDVEDLDLSDTENTGKKYNLQVVRNTTGDKTDVEDFYASDNDNDRVLPEYSRTPDILRQMGGETICSQEGSGSFTQQDRNKLNEKHNIANVAATSPSPTYTDEFITSADDDYYSRAETATPLQMRQELDEASSVRVHNQTTKKIDLDAEDEVMYLKGGGFVQDGHTDTEELGVSEEEYYLANEDKIGDNQQQMRISVELQNEEWGPTKATPSAQEAVSVQDAAPQDSGAVRKDNINGNQRTLGASRSKLKSTFIPNFSHSSTPVSSYTHLDKILDHMLAEVDEQERLVHLDTSQNYMKPVCVNSLQLVPSTDAIIEIPVSHFPKSPKLFETKHEIVLCGDAQDFGIEVTDLDDEMSLTTTLNRSQDSDSLFSFESLSELYFLENVSNKYKASCESLSDVDYTHMHVKSTDDDHVYEIVEPKENYAIINDEPCENQQDIWWEGTYRDLSIVPEEDEDNISEFSQCNRNKNAIQSLQEFPAILNTQLNEYNYENVSVHSSDTSQTTGDEYESSDVEHSISCKRPVKAEVKLIVKTLDRGKEDVEIRSVRDFANQVKNESIKKPVLNSLTNTFPRREKPNESKSSKPTFTLQRLFIRSPDSAGFVTTSKELSKSNPELVATSNVQYPLQYDPKISSPDCFKNINPNIDLYANTPFYPCYGSYMKTENIKVNSSKPQSFPTAYCDWLLQPDDPNGGNTTSPSKQLASNEVTGESIINDVLSKDIKPVIDQTKMFIRMESQPESSNVCVVADASIPSQKVKSPDQDKASKELDNKKEKSKGSRGFFSSLKSLVGRSLDSSDSESKEEKTPKKKKKEKGTPKKGKKTKDEQSSPKVSGKSKEPSPKLEKRTKALYESQELDNIPSIDEIETNGIQVTDLDAEPYVADDVKVRASAIVDNVINDSQKAASKLLEGKIQEFNLEGTVTPEEVRRSTEPIIINEDEFLVVIEPNNYTQKIDEKYENVQKSVGKVKDTKKVTIEKIPDKSDDEEKSDTLKRKSVGFLKLFGKKDSKESDDESRTDDQKQTTVKVDDKSEEHRKSTGFFSLFSKKPSKDEEPVVEEKDEIIKEEKELTNVPEKIEFSNDVQTQMIDTADFLLNEVQLFEDVKPNYAQNLETKDIKTSLTAIGQDTSNNVKFSKEIQQQMVDTTHFLMREVELFEDVRPQTKEEVCVEKQAQPIETSAKIETNNLMLSDEVQQQIVDTAHFLLREVENFEDVRPVYPQQPDQNKDVTVEFAVLQESQNIAISRESQQQIVDSANFLYTEVELFEDVRPQVISAPDKKEVNVDSTISQNISGNVNIQSPPPVEKEDKKDPAVTKPAETTKQEGEQSESKSGFFSKLGKFGGKSIDKKDEPKEKKAKKKKEKKPGFFSKIGERFSTLSSDDEKEMKDSSKLSKENIEKKALKIENKIKSDIKDQEIEPKTQITKELSNIKDKTATTVQESISEVTDVGKHLLDKNIAFVNNIGEEAEKTEARICTSINDKSNELEKSLTNTGEVLQESVDKTGELFSDVKDKTVEQIKNTATDSKEKSDTILCEVGNKIKETVHDTKESAIIAKDSASQMIQDTVVDVKDTAKDVTDKTQAAVSDTGDIILDAAKNTKEDIVSAGDKAAEKVKETASDAKEGTKEAIEKTGGFFSGLGKKIKGTAKDTKQEVISKAKSGKEKVEDVAVDTKETLKTSAEKSGAFLSDVGENIKDKAQDATETMAEAKEKAAEAIKESVTDTKDSIKDTVQKVETVASDVGGKIKDVTKDTLSDAQDTMKTAADKTGAAISDTGAKIKEVTKDTKDSVVSAGDKASEKVKDTASDAKEAAKGAVEKTGGFFSGLGKKIKGTAKDTKEEVVSKSKSAKEKVEDVAQGTKDTLQDSIEKTEKLASDVGDNIKDKAEDAKDIAKESAQKVETAFSGLGENIKDVARDTKEGAIHAKESASQMVKDSVSDAKEKTEVAVSNTGDTIKDALKETKDEVESAENKASEKLKDFVSDTKDTSKDVVDKTGGFFSGLGKKIKGTAKDAKEEVVSKAKSGKEKVEDVAVGTKDVLKDTTEKTSEILSDVGDKIKDKAQDMKDKTGNVMKETLDNVKDKSKKAEAAVSHVGEEIKDTAKDKVSDAKDALKDVSDKTVDAARDTGNKIKEVTKDTKDNVVSAGDKAAEKIKDTASEAKEVTKEAVEMTGGFFSGIGQKIKVTAKETEEEVVSKTQSAKEKVEDVASDTRDTLQESADKTGDLFSVMGDKFKSKAKSGQEKVEDVVSDTKETLQESADRTGELFSVMGDKFKVTVQDARESVSDAREKSSEKIKDTVTDVKDAAITAKEGVSDMVKQTVSDAKDTVQDLANKTGTVISDTGDKMKESAQDTKNNVVAAGEKGSEKVKDTAADAKDAAKDAVEKTGGFFSSLGKKIKGSAKDTKDEVVSKTKSGKEKVGTIATETNDTLIDLGVTIKDKTQDAKEIGKDLAEKTGAAISHVEDKIKDAAKDTKESAITSKDNVSQIVTDTISDAKKTADKTEAAISNTGVNIKETVKDTKEDLVSAGDKATEKMKETASDVKEGTKEALEKTGGFFSGLGKKIKGTAKDTKQEVISKAKSGKEKVEDVAVDTKETLKTSAEKSGAFLSDVGENIKDKAQDATETMAEAKEKAAEAIKESVTDTKDSIKDTVQKVETKASNVGGKIKDVTKDTVSDAQDTMKTAADKTGAAISDTGDKIKEVAKDTKDSVVSAGDKASEKVKDTATDAKEAAKGAVEKTGGFFSGLGKKIKGTAKDTKEEVVSKSKSAKEKVEDVAQGTKDILQDSVEKTGKLASDVGDNIKDKAEDAKDIAKESAQKVETAFSGLGENINDVARDTKEGAIHAKESASQMVKDTVSDAKEKTEVAVSSTGETIKEALKETKDKVESVGDKASEKLKDFASDTKDTSKDIVDKTGGFFSGLGKKIKGTAKEAKEEVVSKAKSGKEKVEDVAVETKDVLKDTTEKTSEILSDVGDKIKDKAQDMKDKTGNVMKETLDNVKDKSKKAEAAVSHVGEEIKDTAKDKVSDAKDALKDVSDKTVDAARDTGNKIKEVTKDTKDNVVSAGDKTAEKLKDTASEAKEVTKEAVEMTGGFFSGIGKKIKETAKETEEEVVSKAKSGKEKVEDVASGTRDTLQKSADKTGDLFSVMGDKFKSKAKSGQEKVEDVVSDTKETLQESADRTGEMFSVMGDKFKSQAKSGQEKVEDVVSDTKDTLQEAADKTGEMFSVMGDKFKSKAKSGQEKVEGVVSDTKDSLEESAERTGEMFSVMGDKFKSKAKSGQGKLENVVAHTKDTLEESADRTGELFSVMGDKFKGKVQDTKESVSNAKEKTSEKIKDTITDVKDVVEDKTQEVKETVTKTKEKTTEKISDTHADAKCVAKNAAGKAEVVLSNIGDNIKECIKSTNENVGHAVSDAKDTVKDATDKSGTAIVDTGDKIREFAKDTKASIISAGDTASEKVKDTVSDTKEAAKESVEKTGGFFSSLGKKIKGTAKDAKEEVVSKTKSGKDKLESVATDTKETLKESTEKTGVFFSDVGQQIHDTAVDAKVAVQDTVNKTGAAISDKGEKVIDSTKNIVGDTKNAAKEISNKTGIAMSETTDKIKETAKDTKDSLVAAKDKTAEKVKESASDTTEAAEDLIEKTGGFLSGIGKKVTEVAKDGKEEIVSKSKSGKEKVETVSSKTSGALQDSAEKTGVFFSHVGDEIKNKAQDAKSAATDSADKAKVAISNVEDSIQNAAHDAKDTVKDITNKTGTAISNTGDKITDVAKDTKNTVISAKDQASEKVKETAAETVEKTGGFFSGLEQKIKGTAKDTKQKVSSKAKSGKEKVEDIAAITKDAVKDSTEKTGAFISNVGDKIKDEKQDAKEFITEVKDKTGEKAKESLTHTQAAVSGAISNVKDAANETGDKIKESAKDTKGNIISAGDKVAERVKDTALDAKEAAKDAVEKTEGFLSGLGKKLKGDGKSKKIDKKIVKDNLKESNSSDFVCYVTTPTMQRKGIGGSQRLSNDERPALIDVSNMPIDISSDEDDYIVTEPTDDRNLHKDDENNRSSPFVIENIPETDEFKLGDDDKRRPLFRIGSKDEESREEDLSDWSDKKDEHIHSKDENIKSDTISKEHEAQSDIDLIENKLAELGKALDDLEQVNVDLEPQNEIEDKNERKLRRVERRFERMASETMEKDIKEAKDSKLTSPEIEAKQDEDFRKMVSQLSQEEVSECQKLYSTLWDDITFTPSEEWDSKTPDSQPDEIQELPQGEVVEVVYMGPVTLNKDHLINTAGIEVDVIPIKRSPCTSPLPKKKLLNKGRAKSAMGFYKERQVEERGSLPDLLSAGKSDDDVKLDIQKGSIMSAILKVQPTILKEKSSNVSTSSLYFNAFDTDDQFGRRKSTDSLTRGSVVSAVKEWMVRSTPFGSTDNIRSTDAISLADTTISVFDDDDNDSVDLFSDSACQLESESSKSDTHIPDIHIISDCNVPARSIYDSLKFHDTKASDNDVRNSSASQIRRVLYTLDQFPVGETSGGPLTNITTEGSTHLTNLDTSTELTTETPKPKPRNDKTPDSSKADTSFDDEVSSKQETSEVVAEDVAYSDRRKFWESVASKKDEEKTETSVKKRMSLYEEQIYKQSTQEQVTTKKRTSVHEIGVMPPVPKPRSTLSQIPAEEESQKPDTNHTQEKKEAIIEKPETLVSEYRAAFKDPNLKTEQPVKQEKQESESTVKSEKSESIDSEAEYLKYEHQAYENPGYLSDEQEIEQKISEKQDTVPQIKRRQMSVSQPPVAAARKNVFERSVSLPTEDLQDVSEKSVKARKQFFEQQLKKEMVIDQLMTQLEEEELQEYKTLPSTEDLPKIFSPEEKLKIDNILTSVKITEKEMEKEFKEIEKKLSPISSSSSQDTKTEDDITQYTPTSVKDLTRYFQPNLAAEFAPKLPKDPEPIFKPAKESEFYDNTLDSLQQEMLGIKTVKVEKEISTLKQSSTESEQSISSERSIELGSADELQSLVAEALQYKSDSISKPSDSLEVHFDKSEIEDSEKVIDMEQDGTDVEVKSLGAEEYLLDITENEPNVTSKVTESKNEIKNVTETHIETKNVTQDQRSHREIFDKISPIREHKEEITDTVWEVSVESQSLNEIVESVTEIPIDRQIIVEKDEELSGSVRDESDLGSEIHQDHSESYSSERARSASHSEVEQLILESLYHQKIHPDDARKIASELIDDIEAEIERRNLNISAESDDSEPPVPHPEVARNQISDYLRQLAESKGLDAKEVELVESVLARKQNELSKLDRNDTQTSSMEITDEDLKYSGGECDISPSDSHENLLEEQIEQLEHENELSDLDINITTGGEKFSEKVQEKIAQDIHIQQDREIHEDNTVLSLKTETVGKVETSTFSEKEFEKKSELLAQNTEIISKDIETKGEIKGNKEEINLQTEIKIKSDIKDHAESISTKITDDKKEEHSEKTISEKKVTDTSEIEELSSEEANKTTTVLKGVQDSFAKTHEVSDTGFADTIVTKKTEVQGQVDEKTENKVDRKQETTRSPDGTETISEEIKANIHSKTVTTSEVVDQKREERTSVTTIVQEIRDEPITTIFEEPRQTQSDESKSSPYESAKSPEDLISSSSSIRKDDSDTSHIYDKPEVVLRKTKFHKEMDTSSSSGNLKTDRRSGADFEAYSSSGESHYHSFEQDSGKSRPCSSDVEGLMAAGSSEYESALTSQDISSRSHITSTEYHTAVSSLSSRESMKSLDSESSGNMASIEVSEASETLVPSTFELEGDILDGAVSQLLEDEVVDSNDIIEPYDRNIPEHVIRGEYPMKDKKSSFDTISDSDIHGESMDISEEDSSNDKPLGGEITSKMKRSHEMTFQPVPKAIIADSPQSENALEMDERFGSSLEDGSVLSISLSSQSDVTALRTVIEASRRDSDKLDCSMTMSGQDSISASNMSLDKIQPLITTATDTSTSTGTNAPEPFGSVTLTTSTVDENGTQSVCTQVTSQAASSSDEVYNGPTQVEYVPEYDDVIETKKVRGHRRQESTSTFVPSMIPGFTPRTDVFKSTEHVLSESEKHTSVQLTLKEEHHEEMKDVDETEEKESSKRFYTEKKESLILERDSDEEDDQSRPQSRISKTDSEDQRGISTVLSDDKPDSELLELMKQGSEDILSEPIERPLTPEPLEEFDFRGSVPTTPKSFSDSEKHEILYEKQMKMSISEKSSIEEGEAEAAFSMVAHISPAHKAIKGDICPIMEDEDAEKHELETRERAQKEMERRRALIREQSPGNIPDIMVTEHMTPLVDREFHYPDLELEEKEALARSAPQTPGSVTSRSSEDTDQGREYVLEDPSTSQVILEEPEPEESADDKRTVDSKSDISHSTTVEDKTVYEPETREPADTESPNSDSFEMLEQPDIIDDFVVIEEVAKEAAEHDTEGKSVEIKQTKYIRKHDEEVEEYLVKSAPTPLTRMTDLKYYPDGSSGDELGPFDFEDSPPQAGKKSTGTKTQDVSASRSYAYEYDKELEASKKWIEMQFQGDQQALINAGYGYEMEFERGPLEDIKEEEATDFESSRIGSLDSQKQSIGSLGSVKDSFSSTPEYDVLAGRKFFTRSGEHDDVSMSSLQEFEHLERVISLENRRHHQGSSQDSSSNGSFSKRYNASRSGQGDDVSMSSLKEFEGLETACIEAHIIEVKAKEEEALLTQIDEAQENLISESESCKSLSSIDKKNLPESEEEDYEKRMFEIDEIIKQAQSNVEKFIDIVDKTESMGRGDSLEEVAKVPDLELDEPVVKSAVHTVKWGDDDIMQTSTDSLDIKPTHHESTDSLDIKPSAADPMTTSTDSIEYHLQSKTDRGMMQSDSIEMQDFDRSCMITSDSLELTPSVLAQSAQMSDSIDEDGSRIGEPIAHDQSSSSGFSIKDENADNLEMRDHRGEFLLGSTDSLDPSSSTATHATYQYETDSVMSGSFTSGGSNTMVSSTDTIDPLYGQAQGVDLAAAVRKVWFDDDSFGTGTHFTTELLDDGSKPFVTEVIEPCEGDPEYSHTVHRKVELPPEIKKITFKGPNADLQLRQYIENFGEGEDVQESQEVDKDGNVHVKRVVQKRFIVKSDPSGEEKRISGPELESYLQQVSTHGHDEYDLSYRDPSDFGLSKQTRTDSDGTKTIYGQKFTTQYVEGQGEESSLKQLLSSIASDVTESSTHSEYKLTRHVDNQQENTTGNATATFSGAAAANVLRAQGSRRKPLRFDISVDDQTEVDPREHDWRFNLPRHDEHTPDEKPDSSDSKQTVSQPRDVSDQHQLSSEMKELLEEMEKHSKQ